MNTYKKYASVVQLLSIIVIFANSILTTMHWFFPLTYKSICEDMGFSLAQDYNTAPLAWGQVLAGFLIESIALIMIIYGLYRVIQLMDVIKRGQYFSIDAIMLFTCITKVTFVYAIYNIFCTTFLSLITSLNNVPGERVLLVRFGSADITNCVIFCFMSIMMTIFQRGYELRHEQELTV